MSKSLARKISRFGWHCTGGIWKGDIIVAHIGELEEMDASELHTRRLNANEVKTPQRSGNIIFAVADGTVKIFGRGQRLRTSTLTRERPERGEEQEILRGRSDELDSPTNFKTTQRRMMWKLKMTSGRSQENLFTVITWSPESNCKCRERRNISYSAEVHRRYQNIKNVSGRIVGRTD